MWFTIALSEINNIPTGTLLRIIECTPASIKVVSEETGERVRLHQPVWWLESIGLDPKLFLKKRKY